MSTNHYFEEVIGFSRSPRALLRGYAIGFALSLLLTAAAYLLATNHLLAGSPLLIGLLGLALAQFIAQIVCFLHLDAASSSRDRVVALTAIIAIVLILVIGSLWIMAHLNDRMMADPDQMRQYMDSQSGL